MMIEQFRQTGYKRESVELTAEALVAAQYGTVWEGSQIVEEMDQHERRPDRATFRPLQSVGGGYLGTFSGTFEPRPSGTDGTAPDWYQLCTASGATVATDVLTWGAEAVNVSGVIGDTVTIKTRDGVYERTLAGARFRKLRFFAKAGDVWQCEAEAVGRYSEAAQAQFLASANPSAGLGQPFLGMACSVGSFAGSVASVEISIENEVTGAADGTHASAHGRNVITGQKLLFKASLLEDGSVNWRDKARNDAAGDLLSVSMVMSTGAAGNVLTWTGDITLTAKPTISYVDGIGYAQIEGEFTTVLTLIQS